uniref:Uncharacterized protein n=1 Tax=Salix viminalis TaxID=40686 RepID=A0A6N2MSM2_SALVM
MAPLLVPSELLTFSLVDAVEDDPSEVEPEGRPSRLGLGAREVPHLSKARQSQMTLSRGGYLPRWNLERDSIQRARDDNEDDDSSEKIESITRAFAKKRPAPLVPTLQLKKKQK